MESWPGPRIGAKLCPITKFDFVNSAAYVFIHIPILDILTKFF